jgi:hypothetical protein
MPRSPLSPSTLGALLLSSLLVSVWDPRPALGHGDLPVSQRIYLRDRTIYVSTQSWGVFVGAADGAGPWRWICDEAINENRLRGVVMGGDGTLYATDVTGLSRSLDGGCSWDRLRGEIAARQVFAMLPDPAAPRRLWVALSPGPDAPGALYRSEDQGISFAQVHAHPDGIFSGLASTPDGGVLHASLVRPEAQESWIYSVRGARISGARIQPIPAGVTAASAVVLAADPRDPDRVYVRMQGEQMSVLLQVRADTGAAAEALRSLRPIRQVLIDAAQDRVLVAAEGGILASAGGGPFAPMGGLAYAQCLAQDGAALYACAWNFDPDRAAVARSTDGGRSFQRLFQYQDTATIAACPAGSSVAQVCPTAWNLYAGELGIDPARRPGPGPGIDPEPMPMTPGCAAAGGGTGAGGALLPALGLLATLARRRFRPRRPPREDG